MINTCSINMCHRTSHKPGRCRIARMPFVRRGSRVGISHVLLPSSSLISLYNWRGDMVLLAAQIAACNLLGEVGNLLGETSDADGGGSFAGEIEMRCRRAPARSREAKYDCRALLACCCSAVAMGGVSSALGGVRSAWGAWNEAANVVTMGRRSR